MQSENRFFDDLAKMVNGIAGTVAGAGREAEAAMRERAKEFVGRMDFVSREEFEAVKEMAARARAEAETLKARQAVIVAGGAFGSPQTLMLSGIGPAEHLFERIAHERKRRHTLANDFADLSVDRFRPT